MVDPLSYFSFPPELHDWCNKGRGMCYPVCGMMHIKEPLLLIGKSSPYGGSGFPLCLCICLSVCLSIYLYMSIYLSIYLHWRRKRGGGEGKGGMCPPTFIIGGGGNGMFVPPPPPPPLLAKHFYFPLELYVYIALTNNYLTFFIYQLIILWTISIN